MFKNLAIFIAVLALLSLFIKPVLAQENPVNVYFFWGDGCPHCAKAEPYLENLKSKYPQLNLYSYEVWYNNANQKLFIEAGRTLNTDVSGVPLTIIGDKPFIGFDEILTAEQIEKRVSFCTENNCPDSIAAIVGIDQELSPSQPEATNIATGPSKLTGPILPEKTAAIPDKINLPVIGEVQTKYLSLPVFTVVLAALDGFNPCAMWTLLFLISLLLGMKDKKRMWILGTIFIATSAAVYFLFMAAWLNLILFIGFVVWIRSLIGVVALAGGGYNLKEYFTNPESGCKVTGDEKRQQVFNKLKSITQNRHFILAVAGIMILAFSVNLVELICSAGLPAVYTQVLSLSNLARWQYYAYLLFYILIFMLDDLIVFFIAMSTLQMTGITTKYSRLSHLIGGIVMLIIGLLLLFKPEYLMFG